MDIPEGKLFFLDTTGPYFSAGFRVDDSIISEYYPIETSHSVGLEKRIKEFLSKSTLILDDFDSFIYNSGPGSFTGLRIGSSFLAGLSLSINKPLFHIPLLNILKREVISEKRVYLRSSKKREFYYYHREIENFRTMRVKEVSKKFAEWELLYDGNLDFPNLNYKEINIKADLFLKNADEGIPIKNGVLKYSYVNDPDIR